MTWSVRFGVLFALGLLLSIAVFLFEPRSLSLSPISAERLQALPIETLVPTLLLGMGLGAAAAIEPERVRALVRGLATRLLSGLDIVLVGLVCAVILFYL